MTLTYQLYRDWVIARIEAIFEGIVDALAEEKTKLSITLSTRSGTAGRKLDSTNGIVMTSTGLLTREITFPGSTAQEAWRFSQALLLLSTWVYTTHICPSCRFPHSRDNPRCVDRGHYHYETVGLEISHCYSYLLTSYLHLETFTIDIQIYLSSKLS